jgi:hypothetical protein
MTILNRLPAATGTFLPVEGGELCQGSAGNLIVTCDLPLLPAATGTFGPAEGGELCLMCPANYTTLADGSVDCNTPVRAISPIRICHISCATALVMALLNMKPARRLCHTVQVHTEHAQCLSGWPSSNALPWCSCGHFCSACSCGSALPASNNERCPEPWSPDLQVGEGLDLSSRYAVIVSFGVLLNGTALNEIAQRVGVNASSEAVLDTLVRCAGVEPSIP